MAEAISTTNASASNCADIDLDLSTLFDPSAESKTNKLSVYCPRCPSLILRASHGNYAKVGGWLLPDMQVRLNNQQQPIVDAHRTPSSYQHFWSVVDIFTFENVGYTNTVDGRFKYLTCADCECGPLGVQVVGDQATDDGCPFEKNVSYLALARVVHR